MQTIIQTCKLLNHTYSGTTIYQSTTPLTFDNGDLYGAVGAQIIDDVVHIESASDRVHAHLQYRALTMVELEFACWAAE